MSWCGFVGVLWWIIGIHNVQFREEMMNQERNKYSFSEFLKMRRVDVYIKIFLSIALLQGPFAGAAPVKITDIFKPKTLTRVVDDAEAVANAEWEDPDGYRFVNATAVNCPERFVRAHWNNLALFPKLSSAIKKFEVDTEKKWIRVEGAAHGLQMRSTVVYDTSQNDHMQFRIIQGDLTGLTVDAFLVRYQEKNIVFGIGRLPRAKMLLPGPIQLVFRPVSEILLSAATKNFKNEIEALFHTQAKQ